MNRFFLLLLAAMFAGCAHFAGEDPEAGVSDVLWREGHAALAREDFATASTAFRRLSDQYRESEEGREALFYLGTLRIDPRNPAWNPEPAVERLRSYLALDTLRDVRIHRRPEAQTLLQLAEQLTMPPEERVPGLQPEPQVEVVKVPEEVRVVVPATESRALKEEIGRLERQVAERDEQIRRQREELDRIKKTLVGPRS